MENMRDGLEDYDYLCIVRNRMEQLSQSNVKTESLAKLEAKIRPLYAPGNELVENVTSYTQDTQLLTQYRRRLAKFVLAADAALKSSKR